MHLILMDVQVNQLFQGTKIIWELFQLVPAKVQLCNTSHFHRKLFA